MEHGELNDEECFDKFIGGDESGFEALVRRYEAPLTNFLVRLTGNRASAEDAFQDAFLRVYEKRHLFKPGLPFKPWLYRIAVNAARDRFRVSRHESGALPEGEDVLDTSSPSPLREISRREIADRVAVALEQLPAVQKQVFLLREYDDLSYTDISEVLQRPVNTVKSDMRRGLEHLRQLLGSLEVLAVEGMPS